MSLISHKCNVSHFKSGTPFVECQKRSILKFKNLVINKHKLKMALINQYQVYNSLVDICFECCKFGIFSATCPVEPLYSLESGIIKILFLNSDQWSSYKHSKVILWWSYTGMMPSTKTKIKISLCLVYCSQIELSILKRSQANVRLVLYLPF